MERANILDDAFNLARAGQLSYDITLGLIQYLTKESDFEPWAAVANNIEYINDMLYGASRYGRWRVRSFLSS